MGLYELFENLKIDDKSYLGLDPGDNEGGYFCTPKGTYVIGWEGTVGIHFGFIEGFGEMVFAINPCSGAEDRNGMPLFVYPLAENFEIFLRLILAGYGVYSIEQIVHFTKEEFKDYLKNELMYDKHFKNTQFVLNAICNELSLTPLENPYDYVKKIQNEFDYSKLRFTDEYYDILGLANPLL